MINEEKWQELVEKCKSKFSQVRLEKQAALESLINQEFLYFSLPSSPRFAGEAGQDIKLIWSKRPKVLDKKTHYSNRAGGDVQVDYQYSPDEFTYHLEAEVDQNGNWVKMDLNEIINYFI
jgi:hypothetical protein